MGSLRRSDRHVYRLRSRPRRIPEREKIHRSVLERMQKDANYRPSNLPSPERLPHVYEVVG